MPISDQHFPALPRYSAKACPIFIEPIIGSGERICVGIVAHGQDGEHVVVKTIKDESAACMLGVASVKFLNIVQLVINNLDKYAATKGNITDWKSPVPGVVLGSVTSGYVTDLTMMVRTVARNHAFLSAMSDFSAADESIADNSPATDRWATMVKEATTLIQPNLIDAFNRQLKLTSKGTTRFDFVGQNLAAQLGRIIPGHGISGLVKTAKAKLWDLETLREFNTRQLFTSNSSYELILYRPKDNDPAYSEREIGRLNEAIVELEETGDKLTLRVVSAYSAHEAAERIISTEVA
ncbi:hypothetical protein [Rheinheimera salexigens]|uniref:Uncharacterized protein n=1 Tax=Rheinheimera salexigens TaxID=1628148 RepID=A0A1E7Q8A8_9GAMM|nr:hypothetical protein [Rheinheimera salexigens]OEY70360.1 hypothetical protein BI198_12835 [Rheinheimera salexigens]